MANLKTVDKSTIEKFLEAANAILASVGDVDLNEVKTWAEVEAKAQRLRDKGHENDEQN